MTQFLLILGVAVGYTLLLLISPMTSCRSCGGWGAKGRRRSACPRCNGTGRQFRIGARLIHRSAAAAYRNHRNRERRNDAKSVLGISWFGFPNGERAPRLAPRKESPERKAQHMRTDVVSSARSSLAAATLIIRWPDACDARPGKNWPAPLTAQRLTALVALGEPADIARLWTSLTLPEQVNVFAALALQARASAYDAERCECRPSLDLGALHGAVCPGILDAAVAAVTGADEWEIPACPECLRAAAEALAELRIANWQAVIPASRHVIARHLSSDD